MWADIFTAFAFILASAFVLVIALVISTSRND